MHIDTVIGVRLSLDEFNYAWGLRKQSSTINGASAPNQTALRINLHTNEVYAI